MIRTTLLAVALAVVSTRPNAAIPIPLREAAPKATQALQASPPIMLRETLPELSGEKHDGAPPVGARLGAASPAAVDDIGPIMPSLFLHAAHAPEQPAPGENPSRESNAPAVRIVYPDAWSGRRLR